MLYCCLLSLFLQPRRARKNRSPFLQAPLSFKCTRNYRSFPHDIRLSCNGLPGCPRGACTCRCSISCGATARGAGRFRTSPAGPVLCPALAFQGRSCNCTDLLKNIDLSRSTRHGRVMRLNFGKRTMFFDVHLSLGTKQVFIKPYAKQHALWFDPQGV